MPQAFAWFGDEIQNLVARNCSLFAVWRPQLGTAGGSWHAAVSFLHAWLVEGRRRSLLEPLLGTLLSETTFLTRNHNARRIDARPKPTRPGPLAALHETPCLFARHAPEITSLADVATVFFNKPCSLICAETPDYYEFLSKVAVST